MFCKQCGSQLEPGVAFCPACNAPQAQQAPQEEVALAESKCQFAKGAGFFVSNGNVMVTNQRIVYFKHGIAKTLVMGLAVHLTKGNFDFEIPLESIAEMKAGRQGLVRYTEFRLASGEKHRIYFLSNYEGCMGALQQALPHVPIVKK